MSAINIRPFKREDVLNLVALFRASVRGIASRDYSDPQIQAWAPAFMDLRKFADHCAEKSTWVAEIDGHIAGFSDLESDGHIDTLYVHPDFEHRGVARALLEYIETVARSRGIQRLYTEASVTARPVLQAQGFIQIAPQSVAVRGERVRDLRMEKTLEP